MKKPTKKPIIIRKILYILESVNLIFLLKNWIAVPLDFFGLINFKEGYILRLRNGPSFLVHHFMEALTVEEMFGSNVYNLAKSKNIKTIIDIGANIGTFSVFSAVRNAGAKIFAYEPSGKTFNQLGRNISLNNLETRIKIYNIAIGRKRGSLKLYDSGISGQKSIYKTRRETKYETVKIISLKDVFEQNRIARCDFMKIDCEGAEYEILLNTPKEIFNKTRIISLEFHEMVKGQDHKDLVDFLIWMGYKVKQKYHQIENNTGYIYAERK